MEDLTPEGLTDSSTKTVSRNVLVDSLPEGARLVRFVHRRQTVEFCVTHPTDEIQKQHLSGKFYEQEELAIIEAYFDQGSAFIDIGANVGNHSVFCGLYLNPSKIILAEPNPDAIRTLLANISLNGLNYLCDCSRLGVGIGSESAKDAQIVWPYKHWSTTNIGGAQLKLGSGNLSIIRGDEFIAGDNANFLKIDCEGMEIMVLEGLSMTIAQNRPKLFIEVDQANYEAMDKWLDENNYHVAERFSRYAVNCNYLCLPR